MRKIMDLNPGWRYAVHDDDHCNSHHSPIYEPDFDDSSWKIVDVPHDSSVHQGFGPENPSGPRGGSAGCVKCYYNKWIDLTEADCEKEITIEFDGVCRNSNVFVNGKFVGMYPFGYTTFRYRLDDFVHPGRNKLTVEVDNEEQPGSRWYSGTGIYRPVRLILTEKDHFQLDSFVITTPVAEESQALVTVEAVLQNDLASSVLAQVSAELLDAEGQPVAQDKTVRGVAFGGKRKFTFRLPVMQPRRWSHADPYLYTCVLRYEKDGALRDEQTKKVGIRSIAFTPEQGFVINGKQEFLKGVCLHHDNGCLGAIADEDAMRHKIEAVRAMGANAIRTSHNPTSPRFLELCDEYGMYVMEELFDEWIWPKRPAVFRNGQRGRVRIFAYAHLFRDWAERDTRAMICRDRSHPSIVMWSIGNEIDEMAAVEGEQITNQLLNTVHLYDETRPVTAACLGMRDNRFRSPDILDVCGYNYSEDVYAAHREKYPDRVICGSENSTVSFFEERGSYQKFLLCGAQEGVDESGSADPEQQAAMDRSKSDVRFRMDRAERSWQRTKANPFVAGIFLWTGVDYLGETTPEIWPSVSSYYGVIDRALFPKDAFYFYKSQWTDEDVLHILPHWTLPGWEGKQIPVWCYTNCDEVELFVNGKSYGKQTLDQKEHFHLEWPGVPYEPGEVTAIGWRRGRKITARQKTAGEIASVELTLDRESVEPGRLVYGTVRLLDKNGILCPVNGEKVRFEITENLTIAGIDNGSPVFSDFLSDTVPVCGGLARVICRGTAAGEGSITAKLTDRALEAQQKLAVR